MKVRGSVEFRDVEMGVWVLVGEDGRIYQITGGRSSLLKEGQRVEVEGEVDDAAVSVSMVGPVLRVRNYKVL
jgi:F0F1-type ATP synthase alpha subunit